MKKISLYDGVNMHSNYEYIFNTQNCQSTCHDSLRERCEQLESELKVAQCEVNRLKRDLDFWFGMLVRPKENQE